EDGTVVANRPCIAAGVAVDRIQATLGARVEGPPLSSVKVVGTTVLPDGNHIRRTGAKYAVDLIEVDEVRPVVVWPNELLPVPVQPGSIPPVGAAEPDVVRGCPRDRGDVRPVFVGAA